MRLCQGQHPGRICVVLLFIVLTGVVELSSLTNAEATAANNQHLLDIDEILSATYHTAFEVCFSTGLPFLGLIPVRWEFGKCPQLAVCGR